MEGAHIVKYDFHLLDSALSNLLESLYRFGFACPGISHEADSLLLALIESYVNECSVNRQPSPLNHYCVVDGEYHLLHVSEVLNLPAAGNAAYPEVLIPVMIECTAVFPVRISEDHYSVRLTQRLISPCKLEEVGAGNAVGHEISVEAYEYHKCSNLGRIAEILLRAAAEGVCRILLCFNEHSLSLV